MGWGAIISGELKFSKGALAKWKAAPASLPDRTWPEIIATALDASPYDEDPSVEHILGQIAEQDQGFGKVEVEDPDVQISYHVDSSNYSMAAERIVRVVGAAARVGAKGRVRFCDADDAIALKRFSGALVIVESGKLKCEGQRGALLSASDKRRIDEAVKAVRADDKPRQRKPKRK